MAQYRTMVTWAGQQKTGTGDAACKILNKKLLNDLNTVVADKLDPKIRQGLFITVFDGDHAELSKSLKGYQFSHLNNNYWNASVTNFGLPDVRFNISGEYMIFGVLVDRLPGGTLSSKLAGLYALTPQKFQNTEKQNGFQVSLGPGSVIAILAGYLIVTHAPGGAVVFIRWSISDKGSKAQTLQTVQDMLQSYEQLASTDYKVWADLLTA